MTDVVRAARAAALADRRILSAAVKVGEVVASLPRPGRHHNVLHGLHRLDTDLSNHEQGFLTSDGEFVDRVAGWFIAERAGQIRRVTGPEGVLFSEDMW